MEPRARGGHWHEESLSLEWSSKLNKQNKTEGLQLWVCGKESVTFQSRSRSPGPSRTNPAEQHPADEHQRVELLHHPDVSVNLFFFFFNFGLDAVENWVKTLTTPPEMYPLFPKTALAWWLLGVGGWPCLSIKPKPPIISLGKSAAQTGRVFQN